MADQRRALWITWERHRRTRELCRELGIPLHELTSSAPALARYPLLLARTTACLVRRRPEVLFIQCPSVVLAVWAGLLKPLFGYRLVADLHNEAVEPFNFAFAAYRRLLTWIARVADVSVVTNEALKAIVERGGGHGYVLPDRVPDLTAPCPTEPAASGGVVFICSFAADEPYLDVIEAARLLRPEVTVHVTGDHRRLPASVDLPPNVRLTGFLPDAEYQELLRRADVIVDLTRMDNCLVCGAYEAVAVERPLVTSDTAALRGYFTRGAVYTRHDPAALAAAIGYALEHRLRLAADMTILKAELRRDWARQGERLRTVVHFTHEGLPWHC